MIIMWKSSNWGQFLNKVGLQLHNSLATSTIWPSNSMDTMMMEISAYSKNKQPISHQYTDSSLISLASASITFSKVIFANQSMISSLSLDPCKSLLEYPQPLPISTPNSNLSLRVIIHLTRQMLSLMILAHNLKKGMKWGVLWSLLLLLLRGRDWSVSCI